MLDTLQRTCVFSSLLLERMFRAISDDGFSKWKAGVVTIGTEALLVLVSAATVSVTFGSRLYLPRSEPQRVIVAIAIVATLLALNWQSERRWVLRCQVELDGWSSKRRRLRTVVLLTAIAATVVAAGISAKIVSQEFGP